MKCINQKIKSQDFDKLKIIDELTIEASDLFIGFDGLKDNYSLVDLNILQSPHFKLAKALLNKQDIEDTDYFKRLEYGYLDFRFNQSLNNELYVKVLAERRKQIESESYDAVKITRIGAKYYVLDGKHTASLCAVLNQKVKCKLIEHPFNNAFYKNVYLKMMNERELFEKNISLLKKVYN